MKRLILVLSLCSTLSSLPALAQNKQDPVGLGETCGGFMNVPCKEGLECQLSPPGSTAGECVATSSSGKKAAGPGEMCGGIAAIPCQEGLTCTGKADHPDASGKCSERPQ